MGTESRHAGINDLANDYRSVRAPGARASWVRRVHPVGPKLQRKGPSARARQADLNWQLFVTSFYSEAQAFPKQRLKKHQARRYKPTSEGTKGARIPPTRENMEHIPSPTFLEGVRQSVRKISQF